MAERFPEREALVVRHQGYRACVSHGACVVVPGEAFDPRCARGGRGRALKAVDADGWMHTGDLAIMDDEQGEHHGLEH